MAQILESHLSLQWGLVVEYLCQADLAYQVIRNMVQGGRRATTVGRDKLVDLQLLDWFSCRTGL